MYNFELIIRGKTHFEDEYSNDFDFSRIEVSGKTIMKANEEGDYKLPFMDRSLVKYWIGKFTQGTGTIDVEAVALVKIENFPYYPVLSKPGGKAKNRISITKIHKTERHKT